MAPEPPDLTADDVLTADWLNGFLAWARSLRVTVDPSSGLTLSPGAGGVSVGFQATPAKWIRLTGAGSTAGSYSWREQVPRPGGGWLDGPTSGSASSDPAWEANLNASLATGSTSGLIVDATRDKAVGRLSFRARSCST